MFFMNQVLYFLIDEFCLDFVFTSKRDLSLKDTKTRVSKRMDLMSKS